MIFKFYSIRFCVYNRLVVLILAGLYVPVFCFAQETKPIFNRFHRAQGLSDDVVTSVVQDHKGFLWFGTQAGLNRFDGYRFTTPFQESIDPQRQLSGGFIQALHLDQNGDLWVGTRNNGLNRIQLQTGQITHFTHDPRDAYSLIHNEVKALYGSQVGVLWVGTARGLSRLDVATGRFTHISLAIQASTSYIVRSIVEAQDGTLWVGTEEWGLTYYNSSTGQLEMFSGASASLLQNVNVSALHEDKNGMLWMGTSNGLFFMEQEKQTAQRVSAFPSRTSVIALAEDEQGNLWIGTRTHGLAQIHAQNREVVWFTKDEQDEHSLSDNLVNCIFEDQAGVLWIGTWVGLNKLVPMRKWFQAFTYRADTANSLSASPIKPIYEDEAGIIWIGTLEAGLNRFDPDTQTFSHYRSNSNVPNGLPDDAVWALAGGQDNVLWLGLRYHGLAKMDTQKPHFTRYQYDPEDPASLSSNQVMALYQDRTGTLWVGTTDRGLNRFNMSENRFTRFLHDPQDSTSIGHNYVWTMYEDQRGNFWIGTHGGGLNKLDRKTGVFTRYEHNVSDPHSISSNMLTSITEDEEGYLWIGTRAGLNRFDPATEQFSHLTTEDGLPHNDVACVLSDEAGNLWISTSDGFAQLGAKRKIFRTYSMQDGLPGMLFHFDSCLKSRERELLFGGRTGFIFFDPEAVATNDHIPPVVLTSIQVNGRELEPIGAAPFLEQLTFPYNQNQVAFEFAALDYTNTARNQYQYRLQSGRREQDWSRISTQHDVIYESLAPGTYVFQVKGSNNNGIWNEQGAMVHIEITPPYWSTWWFRVLIILVIGGVLTSIYQYRIAQLRRVERTRQRIADDLHDDIGSKISNVALRLDLVGRQPSLSDEDRLQVADLSKTARGVVDDLRDAIWIVDAGHDRLADLLTRMEQVADDMLRGQRSTWKGPDAVPDIALDMEQRRHVYLFFKEALHNAVRHAHAEHIDIRLDYDVGTLRLRVRDDGTGFNTAQVQAGRGLKTLQARAEQLGGQLYIESAPGQGTTVHLTANIP